MRDDFSRQIDPNRVENRGFYVVTKVEFETIDLASRVIVSVCVSRILLKLLQNMRRPESST